MNISSKDAAPTCPTGAGDTKKIYKAHILYTKEQSRFEVLERLERYVYLGDDRQIVHRFCRGKEIAEPKI